MRLAPLAAALLLAIAASPAFAQPSQPAAAAPAAAGEVLASDGPRKTPAGTSFTASGGWSITSGPTYITMTAPEGDTRLTFVDVKAANADEAIAAAWSAYKPDMKRAVRVATPASPLEAWEERKVVTYETSPNERFNVQAIALRAGTSWTVALVEGSDAVLEKRGSQVGLAIRSLRPAGYQRETFAGRPAKKLDVEVLKAFVEDAMKKLQTPGVGLAFLEEGKVIWSGGLGVKELGKPGKVDGDTLFMAASNTKSMTTAMLARLVDEKKLRWDERAIEAFPKFRLGDDATTMSVLVKHLLCACTGMPRQDLEWLFEFKKATPESAMQLLGTMQPTSKFGELFQYSNLMAAAAGYIGGAMLYPTKELGAAYDDAMRTKLFQPLGMKNTTFDYARALRGNHASPHGIDPDGNLKVASMDLNYTIIAGRPAGGVWSSANDMAKFVQMELAKGRLPDGKVLVSEENLLARRAPQVAVGEDVHYGMGLFVRKEWGVPVVHHGGDLLGFHSDMWWFPDHGVGAVILTNSDPGVAIRGPLMRRMAEMMFDGKLEAQGRIDAAVKAREIAIKKQRERLTIPADEDASKKLAGRYVSKELGGLSILRKGKDVVFDIGEWKSTVATRKNEDGTISFVTIDPGMGGFEFVVADKDGKRRLVVRDAQHEYVFEEAGART